MSHFLVIFDRQRRSETQVVRIEDSREAVTRLFEIERDLQSDPGRGVVLLVADDEDALRATHGHYFRSLDELIELAETTAS